MNLRISNRLLPFMTISFFFLIAAASIATAQESSLYRNPTPTTGGMLGNGIPAGYSSGMDGQFLIPNNALVVNSHVGPNQQIQSPFQNSSFIFAPSIPRRIWKEHDIVKIRVDETARTTAQDNASSRKNASFDARLSEWIKIIGLKAIGPAGQRDGDPRIAGDESEVYRADSTLRTSESMVFNIPVEISEIRPNGTLVLSGGDKSIQLNDNKWEYALSGICRPEDIGPDGVVLSRDIFNLNIKKNERGHLRDGLSRGWLSQLYAKIKF